MPSVETPAPIAARSPKTGFTRTARSRADRASGRHKWFVKLSHHHWQKWKVTGGEKPPTTRIPHPLAALFLFYFPMFDIFSKNSFLRVSLAPSLPSFKIGICIHQCMYSHINLNTQRYPVIKSRIACRYIYVCTYWSDSPTLRMGRLQFIGRWNSQHLLQKRFSKVGLFHGRAAVIEIFQTTQVSCTKRPIDGHL